MARKTVRATPRMVARAIREIDWNALDAMTDKDIARQVSENPDAAPLLTTADLFAGRARAIRKRLGLSQPAFAARFRLPVGTVRDWEQGRCKPDRPALAYLRVIEREPEMVRRALETD